VLRLRRCGNCRSGTGSTKHDQAKIVTEDDDGGTCQCLNEPSTEKTKKKKHWNSCYLKKFSHNYLLQFTVH